MPNSNSRTISQNFDLSMHLSQDRVRKLNLEASCENWVTHHNKAHTQDNFRKNSRRNSKQNKSPVNAKSPDRMISKPRAL